MLRWFGSCALALSAGSAFAADTDGEAWRLVREGRAAVILRHARAPGTGDPAGFQLDDCATQRNLSDAGRDQARRIGDLLRANGIVHARVYSSQWCRCLETAELLGLGLVELLPALNSFFAAPRREAEQTAALMSFLAGWAGDQPLVLVTHQVNITAIADVFPAEGEVLIILLRDGTPEVLARLKV
ncbi:MAG TPA: histidine phosphatase family protein [Kiritimatiellia bacterium]|nr:histidine phosphatase family protein [Kiritimatiellia bacterium]HMO98129.1 histidine phosphatase family protein [Kiritimatiellia bacterium]